MRKLYVLVVSLVGLTYAQTSDHIHHLYGLKQETQGILTQAALNQQSGGSVEIETFTSSFTLGGPYSYFNVNNKVLYADTSFQMLSYLNEYLLPAVYLPNYSGSSNLYTYQIGISSLCVNPNLDSLYYAFDFENKLLITIMPNGGNMLSSLPLSSLSDLGSLSQVYFQNSIYLSSRNSFGEAVMYTLSATSLNVMESTVLPFEYYYLVADQQWGVYALAKNDFQEHFLLQLNTGANQFDTIAALPSCPTCIYDKNALVIDSDNGHLILARSEGNSGGSLQHFLSTYDLVSGIEIYNIQTADRWSNLIFQKPKADLVYPGDADHNKLVNITDLLPIGLKYNDQVIDRLQISTAWIGQEATNSQDTLANGVDKKHADCNGDGQINSLDVDAIFENYSSVHYSEKSTNANCDYPMFIQFPSFVKEDEPIDIQIGLDLTTDINQAVYGLTFTVDYDQSFVGSGGISTQGGSTWFGTENGDYIQRFYKEGQGRLAVGVVGIDQENRNGGGGVLLDGIWTMEDVVIPIAQGYSNMNFRISDVTLIDANGNYLEGCGVDTSIRVYDKSVGLQDRTIEVLSFFPNPTKLSHINLENVKDLEQVEMYDMQGRLIQIWHTNFNYLPLNNIPKGIYVLKAYTPKKTYMNKLVYAKE